MKQVYHTNATTNIRLQKEINKSNLSIKKLSENYGVSENTVKNGKIEMFLQIRVPDQKK